MTFLNIFEGRDLMSKFRKIDTPIIGLFIIEPTLFGDRRGFFMESWNKRDFLKIGIEDEFVQDNHSKSRKGVLRGIHFQEKHQQAKLIRCIRGKILDIAVDLRENSETFSKYFKVVLSEENKLQLMIPEGFGHAFVALMENTEIQYKTTNYYCANCENGILYNDEKINIDWNLLEYGINNIILSEKDEKLPTLEKWLYQRGNRGL